MTEKIESWKQDVAKKFIRDNVISKELSDFQETIKPISDIKDSFNDIKKDLLWLESNWDNNDFFKNDSWEFFWEKQLMNILFNNKWEQRDKIWYELNKMKNFMFLLISSEWKNNLDLLYTQLEKSKTEEEFKNNISLELWKLQWDIKQNENNNKIWVDWDNNTNQDNIDWYDNIEFDNNVSDLTRDEKIILQDLLNKSQKPNNINYLQNDAYKKYLNLIESDLNLPKYTLECICKQESWWYLYKWNNLIWSSVGAKWLFQFMPSTADSYMKKSLLKSKYETANSFKKRDDFLKDPLATAWAAWLMISENMKKYNLQTSLACYNRWPWNVQNKLWWKITENNYNTMPKETQDYVKKITSNILEKNWNNIDDLDRILSYDLSIYTPSKIDNVIESQKSENILIWKELLAKNRDEIWWIWNSIMYGIQWLQSNSQFKNMDWCEWKNTKTHPYKFNTKEDVKSYIANHSWIKNMMFYFWWNTSNNSQTLSDLKKRSKWFDEEWIQPILCTCIWVDTHISSKWEKWLKSLNEDIKKLWKNNNYPILDFASIDNEVEKWSDNIHPKSYEKMRKEIDKCLS